MFGDIYPAKFMGKTTDTFGRLKFWLSVKLLFQSKTYAASRESNIELLMLGSGFMVNSTLNNTQRYLCGIHGIS